MGQPRPIFYILKYVNIFGNYERISTKFLGLNNVEMWSEERYYS